MRNSTNTMLYSRPLAGSKEKNISLDLQRIFFKYSYIITEYIISNTDDFISLVNPDGKIIYCNPAFDRIGYGTGDLTNKSIFGCIHPDDTVNFYDLLEWPTKHSAGNESSNFQRILRHHFLSVSGEWIKIESDIRILADNSFPSAFLFISRVLSGNTIETNKLNENTAGILEQMEKEISLRERAEEELLKSEQKFLDFTYSIADVIWEMDVNGNYTYCSKNSDCLYGYSADEIIGKNPKLFLIPGYSKKWEKFYKKKITDRKPFKDIESIIKTKDGRKLNILSNGTPIFSRKGEVIGYRGVDKDITKWKMAEEENVRLAAFPRESPHPILSSDTKGTIVYINPAANKIIKELELNSPLAILPDNHTEMIRSCLKEKNNYYNLEVKVKGHVFSWTYNPIPDIGIIHLHALDITSQKNIEEKLLHDSLHDKLTGLPNRSLFNDELLRAIKISKRKNDYYFAVLFLDLSKFKAINDSMGHLAGDRVITEVAHRISSCLRPEDTASRFGGDEFTILLNNITDTGDPIRIAERIQKIISMPLIIDGKTITPAASIGIVLSSREYSIPEELIRDANTAMYQAKAEGLSQNVIFNETLRN